MNIIIFIIGIVCGVILCVLLECVYRLGKQAGRESASAEETEARDTEAREEGGYVVGVEVLASGPVIGDFTRLPGLRRPRCETPSGVSGHAAAGRIRPPRP